MIVLWGRRRTYCDSKYLNTSWLYPINWGYVSSIWSYVNGSTNQNKRMVGSDETYSWEQFENLRCIECAITYNKLADFHRWVFHVEISLHDVRLLNCQNNEPKWRNKRSLQYTFRHNFHQWGSTGVRVGWEILWRGFLKSPSDDIFVEEWNPWNEQTGRTKSAPIWSSSWTRIGLSMNGNASGNDSTHRNRRHRL